MIVAEKGQPWSIEEIKILRRMRKRGCKAREIQEHMPHRSEGSITARCSELGIIKVRPPAQGRDAYRVMSIAGPPIAEPCRWITDAENKAFKTLMAGRVYEDRRLKNGGLA